MNQAPDKAVFDCNLNLAIAASAFLIVSRDRDLTDLMSNANLDGKRLRAQYPEFQVLTPPEFLRLLDTDSE